MRFKKVLRRPKNIFNKLLLTSSLTIIVTVITLIVLITNYYSDVIVQNELDLTARSLERADNYYTEKEFEVTRMVRDLYGDRELVNDLSYSLLNGYEEYFKHRLDRYVESTTFIPTNFTTFFNDYFDHDQHIIAFILRSEIDQTRGYEFIYDQARWNELIDKKYLNQEPEDVFSCERSEEENNLNVFSINRTVNTPATIAKMGCMKIIYSTEGLKNIFKKTNSEVNDIIFIVDEEGEKVFSTDDEIPLEGIQKLGRYQSGDIKWRGDTYYIKSMTGKNNFTYYGIIPKKELNKLTLVKGTMWLFISLATIMAIFITYSFMRNYAARINQIDASIREVKKGDLTVRIAGYKQNDELSRISESFNLMLDDLNEYIDEAYVLNIKQQQAELKALQSQINPHFLFNTLEVIRMAAIIEGSKTSSKMIYHLSRLFRYTLESKETVPLHTEMENTNQYLKLMQLHYPDKLEVIADVPKEYEDVQVQKLILQPIIENYMAHGFRKDRNDNCLVIHVHKTDKQIELNITDNGLGFTEERLDQVIRHLQNEDEDIIRSIGLKNVHQRLKLKYGSDFGLAIESKEGVETTVRIRIPIGGNENV